MVKRSGLHNSRLAGMSSPASPPPGTPASPSFAATSPADILSYIPHALGFMPADSLVVLTTAGKRVGATLRVDLPPAGAHPLAFAEGVLSFLRGDTEADGALVAVYTQEEWPRLALPPRSSLVLNVEAVLGAAGLPVRGGWLVSGAVWRDYFCGNEECCPWPGQPLDAVMHSALNAELIFGGSAFDASAPEAVLRAAPSVAVRAAAGDGSIGDTSDLGPADRTGAIEDAQAYYAACCSGQWTTPAQFRATSALWDSVLLQRAEFGVDVEPDVTGFLLASVESRTVRDFLLASACLGAAAALDGAVACGLLESPGMHDSAGMHDFSGMHDGALEDPETSGGWALPDVPSTQRLRGALDAHHGNSSAGARPDTASAGHAWDSEFGGDAALLYADVLAGRYTGTIAWDRVDGMSVILARLAAVSDGESQAAALTMSAWFEYARGRGSRAAVFLDAAERAVPDYRLARLLHELLRRGGLPAWARNRRTAWTAGAALAMRDAA